MRKKVLKSEDVFVMKKGHELRALCELGITMELAQKVLEFLKLVLHFEGHKSTENKPQFVFMNGEMPFDELTKEKRVAIIWDELSYEEYLGLSKKQLCRIRSTLTNLNLIKTNNNRDHGQIAVWANRAAIEDLFKKQLDKENAVRRRALYQDDSNNESVEVIIKSNVIPNIDDKILIKNTLLEKDENGVIKPEAGNDLDEKNYKLLCSYSASIIKQAVSQVAKSKICTDPQISAVLAQAIIIFDAENPAKTVSNGYTQKKASGLLEPEEKVDYHKNVKEF